MATVQNDNEELWRSIFAEGHPVLLRKQRWHARLPAPPRCRLCLAPFRSIGGLIGRLQNKAPSNRNPRYCSLCDAFIRANPGGAEVEVSLIFVDIHGSTALAEQMTPTEYNRFLQRFYTATTAVLVETDGFMMDVVGDEVFAIYPPGFSGPRHAAKAVTAARKLLALGRSRDGASFGTFGTAVHTGVVFIGTVSGAEEGIADVRAMGDAVNTAARLCGAAAGGEAVLSEEACAAAGIETGSLEFRELDLRGKSESIGVRILRA